MQRYVTLILRARGRARHNGTMSKHGDRNRYNAGCRCRPCKDANAAGNAGRNRRMSARYLSEGKSACTGKPRVRPYDERALALMAEFGLEPDPRFLAPEVE